MIFNPAQSHYYGHRMFSSITGGLQNQVFSQYTSVVGGLGNNVCAGNYSSILGGKNNVVNGAYSTILGGSGNTVGAAYSYAGIFGQNLNAVRSNTLHVECLNAINTPNGFTAGLPAGTIAWVPTAVLPPGATGFLVII